MVSGKKLVIGYFLFLIVFSTVGFGLVVYLRSLPVAERQQRTYSMLLANAYQKYRFDEKAWPLNPLDAAANFKSENENFFAMTEKAQKEWGLRATVVGPESGEPLLEITFDKPQPQVRKHALRPRK